MSEKTISVLDEVLVTMTEANIALRALNEALPNVAMFDFERALEVINKKYQKAIVLLSEIQGLESKVMKDE